MTLEKLKQIYSILKEIEQLKKQKERISYLSGLNLDGLPKGNDTGNPTERIGIEQSIINEEIDIMLKKLQKAVLEVMEYINSVEDSETRQIMRLRYINCLTWWQVANEIGISEETARRKNRKEIKKLTVCDRV